MILGRHYDSTTARFNSSEKRIRAYRLRIAAVLAIERVSTKELEKLHGCLNYVPEVEPFGRPILAHITLAISAEREDRMVSLSPYSKLGLKM